MTVLVVTKTVTKLKFFLRKIVSGSGLVLAVCIGPGCQNGSWPWYCHGNQQTRPNLRTDGRIWTDLDGSGWIWADLGGSGRIWMDLSGSGRIWTDLDGSGRIWMNLDESGWFWADLGGFVRIWTDLDGFGRIWTYLDGSGRIGADLLRSGQIGADLHGSGQIWMDLEGFGLSQLTAIKNMNYFKKHFVEKLSQTFSTECFGTVLPDDIEVCTCPR